MRAFCALLWLVILSSCQFKGEEKNGPTLYFDLSGFFKSEAARLESRKQPIDKSVGLDGKMERKKLVITNWEREFSAFIDADINKASWRGAFQVQQTDSSKIYTSNSEKIDVKRVEVGTKNGKISFIKIQLKNDNDLYHSNDELNYFPDSLYEIKKIQKVQLMDKQRFDVRGIFNTSTKNSSR